MAKSTKKSGSGKTSGKESQRSRLEKQLKDLLKKIDEDGLIFLLKQANVIIHNMQVDKLNREIVEYEQKRTKKPVRGKRKTKAARAEDVMIESTGRGKSFIITLNNARKIFSLPEMKTIVGICRSSGNRPDACKRLYHWFYTNRSDVIADGGLRGAGDPLLARLYTDVLNTFTDG
ncbi:MAG: hypothetical protein JW881_02070 [Spirochaetales bacterium]|nr:hypothetical protein [Spirochaetales bacterium]